VNGAGYDEERSADCAGCPVGFLRDVVRDAQPEAALHLVTAARELLLAFETVLRATEQSLQREAEGNVARRERPARVRRIDIA
jgi:hypothetical protein